LSKGDDQKPNQEWSPKLANVVVLAVFVARLVLTKGTQAKEF
jgi:hypothetical protein